MTKSAQEFHESLQQLLKQGDKTLLEAIHNGEPSSALETLAVSLTLANELVDQGDSVRIKNQSAQALNDPTTMREGLVILDKMNETFSKLNPLLPEEYLPLLESPIAQPLSTRPIWNACLKLGSTARMSTGSAALWPAKFRN